MSNRPLRYSQPELDDGDDPYLAELAAVAIATPSLSAIDTSGPTIALPPGQFARPRELDVERWSNDSAATNLGRPDNIQDIARGYQRRYGVDLEKSFRSASIRCLVKFRSSQIPLGAVDATC